MRCPKLRKSNSSMLVLFDDSISSISTSQIHHPLCQSTLDPWMTTRCGFCPKNIRSFFPSWRQHYSDHFATSIVSQKEQALVEKRVKQPCFTSSDWLLTRIFTWCWISSCTSNLFSIPCLSVSSNHLFQPKKKPLSNRHAEKWKNWRPARPYYLVCLVFAHKMIERNKTCPYPKTQTTTGYIASEACCTPPGCRWDVVSTTSQMLLPGETMRDQGM